MINFSEQLSAARQSQLEAQLQFFNSFTSKAVASAEKLVALNLNLTRETVEKSSTALCQVLTARDAADLFALSARTPDTFSRMLAYGRDLMSIATGGVLPQPSAAPQPAARIDNTPAALAEAAPEPELKAEADVPASATPLARALDSAGVTHGAAKPVAASFPAAEEVNVEVTGIEPIDAAPPPAPVAGTPEVAKEALAAKGRRKK